MPPYLKQRVFHNPAGELPLRKCVQDMYKLHLRERVHFPKDYKPTVAEDIHRDIAELGHQVNKAARQAQKKAALRDADIKLEDLRDHVFTAHELKCLSEGQLGNWIELMDAAGKMIGGWLKAVIAEERAR